MTGNHHTPTGKVASGHARSGRVSGAGAAEIANHPGQRQPQTTPATADIQVEVATGESHREATA